MSIFEEKDSVSREELKKALGRDSGIIPKTGGEKFYQEKREGLRNVFSQKYGSSISKQDFKSAVKELENARNKSDNPNEKKDLGKQVDYLKRMGGIKN